MLPALARRPPFIPRSESALLLRRIHTLVDESWCAPPPLSQGIAKRLARLRHHHALLDRLRRQNLSSAAYVAIAAPNPCTALLRHPAT